MTSVTWPSSVHAVLQAEPIALIVERACQAAVAGDDQPRARARCACSVANASSSRSKRFCGSSRPTAPITMSSRLEAERRARLGYARRIARELAWSMPLRTVVIARRIGAVRDQLAAISLDTAISRGNRASTRLSAG